MAKNDNIIGQKFNRLTVLEKVGQHGSGDYLWRCECDCKNIIIVKTSLLKSNRKKSCGCISQEIQARNPLIIGQKFERLTVIREVGKDSRGHRLWECQCDCGNLVIKRVSRIVNGEIGSCGKTNSIHLNDGRPNLLFKFPSEYKSWRGAKERCTNPNHQSYKYYGGRGIKFCDQWINSFEQFLKDMVPKPSPKHSLDRIDNNGPYSPENCRWATKKEQSSNRSDNRLLTINGETKPLFLWAESSGIDRSILKDRLKRNWSIERLFEATHDRSHLITYNNKTQSMTEWARELDIHPTTLAVRLFNGWSIEKAFSLIRKRSTPSSPYPNRIEPAPDDPTIELDGERLS